MSAVTDGGGRTGRRVLLRAGVVLPLLAAAAFALLAVDVAHGGLVPRLDARVDAWVRSSVPGRVVALALAGTELGRPTVVPVLLGLLAVGLAVRRRSWRPVLGTAAVLAALGLAVLSLKAGIGRPGPAGPALHGGAFPSGHTTTAIVCWGWALRLLRVPRPRARAVTTAVAGLVGTALVLARFHWVGDVVGGWLLGPVLLSAAGALVPPDRAPRRPTGSSGSSGSAVPSQAVPMQSGPAAGEAVPDRTASTENA